MSENFIPITTSNLTNQTSITSAIDSNFSSIASLFKDVLSRSNINPNAMSSNLDMNSNQIINLPSPATALSPVRLADVNGTVTVTTISPASYARYAATPANPTGTTSTSLVMAGLNASITPHVTGNILALCSMGTQNTTTPFEVTATLKYGTGIVPVNGQVVVGTTVGAPVAAVGTGPTQIPLTLVGYASGLVVGTPYWFDLAFSAPGGGTANIIGPAIILIEV